MAVGEKCCLRKKSVLLRRRVNVSETTLNGLHEEKINHRKIGFSHLPSHCKLPQKSWSERIYNIFKLKYTPLLLQSSECTDPKTDWYG